MRVAHGQLREDELEQVMLDLMNREYDVLVCTTIIENGLDIPNVNTLIVKDAGMMSSGPALPAPGQGSAVPTALLTPTSPIRRTGCWGGRGETPGSNP